MYRPCQHLNNNPFNLFFVFTFQGLELLNLKGDHDHTIKSSTYRKTAGNTILHFNSFHPKHTFKSITVGELTSAKHNCSSELDFAIEEKQICDRLTNKGYQPPLSGPQ